ncbi:hypothetical protein ACFUTU_20215, partial [Arthrobacter sp. NPDC057388]|uniref:hypothetical protein n=1 Tax=Arthrobacter sp. NPDC057388 TaxID=3346116 RepID=UPI003642A9FB
RSLCGRFLCCGTVYLASHADNLRPQVQGKGSNAIKSQGPRNAVSGAVTLGWKKQGRWQTAADKSPSSKVWIDT